MGRCELKNLIPTNFLHFDRRYRKHKKYAIKSDKERVEQ
jgi:hypothetical protein